MQYVSRLLLLAIGISSAPFISHADQITTVAGDQLTGQIRSLSAKSVTFRHAAGSELSVSLSKLRKLSSTRPITVILRGGDRVTGTIELGSNGMLLIRSELLGQLSLPVDTIEAALASSGDAAPQVTEGLESVPPLAPTAMERTVTAPEAARVAGRGRPDMLAQANPTQGSPATTGSDDDEGAGTQLRFLRDETVLLGDRNVEADFVLSYLRNTFDITDDRSVVLTTSIRANLFNNLEGFVSWPVQWAERELSQIEPQPIADTFSGIGDVRFGLKYRLLPETKSFPAVFAGISATAPTGDDPYFNPPPPLPNEAPIIDIRDPFALTPGSGHLSVTGSISFLRSYDPIVLFAGFDYTHVFPEIYYNTDVKPGEIFGYNFGFGFGVSEHSTIGTMIFGNFERAWTFNGVHDEHTEASPVGLRLSYTHRLTPRDFVEPSASIGLTDDANDAVLNFAYTRRF